MSRAYTHHPVRRDWLALGREPALLPELAIVDPHHHLWDRPEAHYLLPELTADLRAGHDVRATVYVQARSMYRSEGPEALKSLGEVEYANSVAVEAASGTEDRRLACAGIVAGPDLTLGERVTPVLEAMREVAGDRFCGVRNSVAWHEHADVRSSTALPPPRLMSDAKFRAGARQLARFNLTLDVWAYQTQLGEVLDLARFLPDTTIVVDHLGGPIACGPFAGRRWEMFDLWRTELGKLARLPNVATKIGGLGMRLAGFDFHTRSQPPTSEELAVAWKPYVETAITLFGAERCMFESNFPVDKGMYGYGAMWNAFKWLTAGASTDERGALFAGTALRIYHLPAEAILP